MKLLAYASDYNGNLIYAKCLDTAQYVVASAVRMQAIVTVIVHIYYSSDWKKSSAFWASV